MFDIYIKQFDPDFNPLFKIVVIAMHDIPPPLAFGFESNVAKALRHKNEQKLFTSCPRNVNEQTVLHVHVVLIILPTMRTLVSLFSQPSLQTQIYKNKVLQQNQISVSLRA